MLSPASEREVKTGRGPEEPISERGQVKRREVRLECMRTIGTVVVMLHDTGASYRIRILSIF